MNRRRTPATTQPYRTDAHRTWAAAVLARDRWCQCDGCPRCHRSPHGSPPCIRSSRDADHHPATLTQLLEAGADPYRPDTGRGLCHRCHSHKTASTDGGFGNPTTA